MKAKTLILAAGALAVGVLTSQAQVYSQNIVGYANVTVPAGQFALVGNQFDTGTNTLNNVLKNGAVGNGSTAVAIWNGSAFKSYSYYTTADGAPQDGWYDASFNLSTNDFGISSAIFVRNQASTNITLTFVGSVATGTNTYVVQPGLNFYSEPIPFAGTSLDNTNINFPATHGQDTYTPWNGTSYGANLTYYTTADGAPQDGWYDASFTLQSGNSAKWPNVGQGFLINHFGSASNWVSTFNQ
jgi:hypothetical protein